MHLYVKVLELLKAHEFVESNEYFGRFLVGFPQFLFQKMEQYLIQLYLSHSKVAVVSATRCLRSSVD